MVKLISIFILCSIALTGCYKPQVLEYSVTGHVRDENNRGVANVTILIDRGTNESWYPVSYKRFDSVATNGNGEYSYLITEWKGSYQVCCRVPIQYSAVDSYCKKVDQTIKDGKTVPNTINFRLRQ